MRIFRLKQLDRQHIKSWDLKKISINPQKNPVAAVMAVVAVVKTMIRGDYREQ